MAFVLDFLTKVIKEISGKEPVYFQRYGQLYIASHAGFAVSPGIEEKLYHTADLMNCEVDKPNCKFKKEEAEYLDAIPTGIDNSLYAMNKVAKAFESLDNKSNNLSQLEIGLHLPHKKIRIISGEYSYSRDTMSITSAKAMQLEDYLTAARQKEKDNLKNHFERLRHKENKPLANSYYLVTPHILVSFPYKLNQKKSFEEKPWNEYTEFEQKYSPGEDYNLHLKINMMYSNTLEETRKKLEETQRQLGIIEREIGPVQEYLQQLKSPVLVTPKGEGITKLQFL